MYKSKMPVISIEEAFLLRRDKDVFAFEDGKLCLYAGGGKFSLRPSKTAFYVVHL